MANCRLYEKQLSSYLDGELGAIHAGRVAAHLNTCPHCRAELDALSGIGHHVRAASSDLRVSNDFDQRVLHSFGYLQVSGRPVRQRTFTKPLLVVAMVLLAMLGMVWHYLTEPFRPPQPAAQPANAVVAPAPPVAPAVPDVEERADGAS